MARSVLAMRSRNRPLRSTLAISILTAGCALCDAACASTNRSAGPVWQSRGFPDSPRQNSPSGGTSKPEDVRVRASVAPSKTPKAASERSAMGVPPPVPTPAESAPTLASLPRESPSMVVTTTQRSSRTQSEQGSNRVWPFLIGVAIAALAGLALLIRRTRIRARSAIELLLRP